MENQDKPVTDRRKYIKLVAAGGAGILASGLFEAGNNSQVNEDEPIASINTETHKKAE